MFKQENINIAWWALYMGNFITSYVLQLFDMFKPSNYMTFINNFYSFPSKWQQASLIQKGSVPVHLI